MSVVRERLTLKATAADVWAVIGDFHGTPGWIGPVTSSDQQQGGSVRLLTLADGAQISEHLISHDEGAMMYSYGILQSPLPVSNYRSTLKVSDNGDGTSTVDWSSAFEAMIDEEKAKGIVSGVYQAGFAGLKEKFDAA